MQHHSVLGAEFDVQALSRRGWAFFLAMLVPIVGALFTLADEDGYAQSLLTASLGVCLAAGWYSAVTGRGASLWIRTGLGLIAANIFYGLYIYQIDYTAYWTLCLAPVVVLVMPRWESVFWALLLFLPSLTYLAFVRSTDAATDVQTANFVLAYLLVCVLSAGAKHLYALSNSKVVSTTHALAAERERFEAFARLASDVLFEFDRTGQLTYLSSAIVGRDATNFVGRQAGEFADLDATQYGQNALRLKDRIDRRESIRAEEFSFALDPTPLVVVVSAEPVFENGSYQGYRGVARDVTHRVAREQRMHEKEQNLLQSQRMLEVGFISSSIAHDFGNYMTVATGVIELAEINTPQVAEYRLWPELKKAVGDAGQLSRQLLDFAHDKEGPAARLSVAELVDDMAPVIRRLLGKQTLSTFQCPASAWDIYSDRLRFESAMLNLAINARDAMPQGGEFSIEVSNCVRDNAEWVLVCASDSGSGMSDEQLKAVFEPFYTTKPSGQGTGLGLAAVKKFVTDFNGEIEIASTPQTGTTLKIYLPKLED